MPNWCSNELTVSAPTREELDAFIARAASGDHVFVGPFAQKAFNEEKEFDWGTFTPIYMEMLMRDDELFMDKRDDKPALSFHAFVPMPREVMLAPYDSNRLQKARIVFRKLFMTELEVRAMIGTDKWDEEGVEEACKTKGMFSWYRDPNVVPTTALAQDYRLKTNNLIEVCYAYYRQLSEDGTPCVYYTVFSPHASSETHLKHGKLGYSHGKYPFVVLRREYIRKAIYETRGITDILSTDQAELKAQRDAMRDRTAFETVPPLMYKRRVGGTGRIGPAMLLPVSDVNADYKWMEPPRGSPQIAEFVVNQIEKDAAGYFGLTREDTPPALSQMLQQNSVDNWLTAWSEVYTQMLQLTLHLHSIRYYSYWI